MSDEGMSDAHLKALAGLYKDADDSGMESKWEAIGNALCNAYPLIIARLDAAERERDALQTLMNRAQPSICYLACEHGSTFEPSNPNIMHSDLCNELRAALTANHSAPVVEG